MPESMLFWVVYWGFLILLFLTLGYLIYAWLMAGHFKSKHEELFGQLLTSSFGNGDSLPATIRCAVVIHVWDKWLDYFPIPTPERRLEGTRTRLPPNSRPSLQEVWDMGLPEIDSKLTEISSRDRLMDFLVILDLHNYTSSGDFVYKELWWLGNQKYSEIHDTDKLSDIVFQLELKFKAEIKKPTKMSSRARDKNAYIKVATKATDLIAGDLVGGVAKWLLEGEVATTKFSEVYVELLHVYNSAYENYTCENNFRNPGTAEASIRYILYQLSDDPKRDKQAYIQGDRIVSKDKFAEIADNVPKLPSGKKHITSPSTAEPNQSKTSKSRPKLNAKEIIGDIQSGMNDAEIMQKYGLSLKQLSAVYKKLREKGLITNSIELHIEWTELDKLC